MTLKERAKGLLDLSREWTLKFLEGIPEDKYTFQPFSGANHVLWTLGHLAETDAYVTHALQGAEEEYKSEKYPDLFGMGSTPVPDPGKYPSPAKIKEYLSGCRKNLLAKLESMSEADLLKPATEEFMAPDLMGTMFTLPWHEAMHGGQIVAVRKALGLKPLM
jgi:hypothetical protein